MSKDDSLPLLGIGWQGVEPEMMAFNRQRRYRAMSDVGGKAEDICSR
jgi:hypothetical protein